MDEPYKGSKFIFSSWVVCYQITRLLALTCYALLLLPVLIQAEPWRRSTSRLGKPLTVDDGMIYSCSGKFLYVFTSNGSIASNIHLNYTCNGSITPVYGGKGKVYIIAENKVLRINSLSVVASDPAVELLFGNETTGGTSDEILGLSASMLTSSVYVNIKNKGFFAYSLRGRLRWSALPVLNQFGYSQGCNKNVTDCYFTSSPVFDSCESSVYISNSEGELYSISARRPHFKWIQDLSLFDKVFTATPGNNGFLYVTVPAKAILLGLDAFTGDVLWEVNIGPLSYAEQSPVVDSNGWVSIGSLDGFLYSISPAGILKKFAKASPLNSVIQVSPVLDCSGYAVYISQTEMEGKSSRVIGEFVSNLSQSDLQKFNVDEEIVLTFIAAAKIGNPLPCRSNNLKLAFSCSELRPKSISVYTGNERAILLFLLFETIILVVLAIIVRFCWIFWGKQKLRNQDLGKFLDKRQSLRLKKKEYDNTISELEKKAAKEATSSNVLENLSNLVREREGIERKLSTTYSLGKDGISSLSKPVLPIFDKKTRSYSFRGSKSESVTIFHTHSTTSDDESGPETNSEQDFDFPKEIELVANDEKGKGKAIEETEISSSEDNNEWEASYDSSSGISPGFHDSFHDVNMLPSRGGKTWLFRRRSLSSTT
ncbi:protein GAMETE EXPRESSED 3 isoform X2 [Spinacia oleracea]|uniref:Protein GAMETE EXPRESSED 3 isoform X2 n=1 Tax=Spinacia oleracea TaxID=3562 RepID=A0ABM3RLV9_SPIOL|nr:protein GAMETE EXPRESSED 3 isoform X2 [Spinacia oleracea]